MRRTKRVGNPNVASEYTAPLVRVHMRDMLADAAKLLAPDAPTKAKIDRVATAMRLPFGRVRRYWYDLVDRVPAEEYLGVQHRLAQLRQRLGTLEQQYNRARQEILENSPALAGLAPPAIPAGSARQVTDRVADTAAHTAAPYARGEREGRDSAATPESHRRLYLALTREAERRARR